MWLFVFKMLNVVACDSLEDTLRTNVVPVYILWSGIMRSGCIWDFRPQCSPPSVIGESNLETGYSSVRWSRFYSESDIVRQALR